MEVHSGVVITLWGQDMAAEGMGCGVLATTRSGKPRSVALY